EHNRLGHPSYLLGQRSMTGWWYFFPVVLAVKTPLAFLVLPVIWLVTARRPAVPRLWIPAAFSAAILLVGMAGHIDIGVRHILPFYIGLSVIVACAAVQLLEDARF